MIANMFHMLRYAMLCPPRSLHCKGRRMGCLKSCSTSTRGLWLDTVHSQQNLLLRSLLTYGRQLILPHFLDYLGRVLDDFMFLYKTKEGYTHVLESFIVVKKSYTGPSRWKENCSSFKNHHFSMGTNRFSEYGSPPSARQSLKLLWCSKLAFQTLFHKLEVF